MKSSAASSKSTVSSPKFGKFGKFGIWKIYRFEFRPFAKIRKLWKLYRSEVRPALRLVAKVVVVVALVLSEGRKTFASSSNLLFLRNWGGT
jgi:hypothetical protein